MITPVEFVLELLTNVIDLLVIFVRDVVLGVDPLTAISWVVGQAMVLAAVGALGYLVLGALAAELGVDLPGLGAGRTDEPEATTPDRSEPTTADRRVE